MFPTPSCLHREQLPKRTCSSCGAYLTSGNETEECWPCGKTWLRSEAHFTTVIREEIGDALDRILAGV